MSIFLKTYNLLDLYILPNSGGVYSDAISDSYGEAIDLICGDCLDFDEDIFGCVDSNAQLQPKCNCW